MREMTTEVPMQALEIGSAPSTRHCELYPSPPWRPVLLFALNSSRLLLVAAGAFCSGVVEHDQAVDGDAGPSVDQKWIDVDRGNSVAGIQHQIGQADERIDDGSFMQSGLAAITAKLHAGLGAADQFFGFDRIERRAGQRDILHQFDLDAAGA